MENNNLSESQINKKKLVNFEIREKDLIAMDTLCDELDISRTRFIKDAISEHMKKYQDLSNLIQQQDDLKHTEQKTQVELNEKVELMMKKIDQLPAVMDPQIKLSEKTRILDLLEQIPMKGSKIATITSIPEEHILKILKELANLGNVEFTNGKWRLMK
jgi:predicted Rossmann fold nucleotide-binding protein DprA/Smf involved in DNA uptake